MALIESWWQGLCGIQRSGNVVTNDDVASGCHRCFSEISLIDDVTTDYLPTTAYYLLLLLLNGSTMSLLATYYYRRCFSKIPLTDGVPGWTNPIGSSSTSSVTSKPSTTCHFWQVLNKHFSSVISIQALNAHGSVCFCLLVLLSRPTKCFCWIFPMLTVYPHYC